MWHDEIAIARIVIRRMLTGLIASVLIALGLGLALSAVLILPAYALSFSGLELVFDLSAQSFLRRVMWVGWGAFASALGVLLLFLAMAPGRASKRLIVLKRALPELEGDTTITVAERGLHALVARATRDIPGVRESDAVVALGRKGWALKCHLSLWGEAAVPEVVRQVDQAVRGALEHHTGVPVARLRIETQLGPLAGH
jgi:hypothetical protein